jgi:ABC-type antimicrobial peptide transport system permease subunit
MTPKEKAIDLVEQFASVLMHDEFYEDSIMCARIAVELLLLEFYVDEFYTEVKHELEKL